MRQSLFIFGFGYTAQYLVKEPILQDFSVTGTTRNKSRQGMNSELGYRLVDFTQQAVKAPLQSATHLLISTPPSLTAADPVLEHFQTLLPGLLPKLQWIGYLSSTGVYGDHQGRWVDESSTCIPAERPGQLRLEAEAAWTAFALRHQLPLYIFRLAGIYGPQRNALERISAGKKETIYKEGQFFSRIHVEDIANILALSMQRPKLGIHLYNLADDEPAALHEVDDYAAALLHRSPLIKIPFEQAELSGMARVFFNSNRRVSNARLKKEFQLQLRYPTFRDGLRAIFESENSHFGA